MSMRTSELKAKVREMQMHREVPVEDMRPGIVMSEAQAEADTTQMLSEVLTALKSKGKGKNVVKASGPLSLSAIGGTGAPRASSRSQINEYLDSQPKFSKFNSMYKTTGVAGEVDRAVASGQAATVFAPTNEALARMPNAAVTNLSRNPELMPQREQFVRQHVTLDHGRYQEAVEEAGASARGFAASPSLQTGVHLGYNVDSDGTSLAAAYDESAAPLSNARLGATFDDGKGNVVHEVDGVLLHRDV